MAYATQITVITGTAGSRVSESFQLGVESSSHRQIVRDLLPLNALEAIEADGFDKGLEVDTEELTQALRNASSLIDFIDDSGLRQDLTQFRDFWFANLGKPAIAFVELV